MKHQESAGAWLSLQNDVLCNRLCRSKSGSALYNSRQQNQRRGGAVRHFRCTDTVSDESDYLSKLSNIIFSCYVADYRCTTIIQIHHLSVKILNAFHYIRNFKEQFSTGSEKDPSTG